MARQSAHHALRPEIEAEFRKGLKPAEIAAEYPDLPRATIYEWYKKRDLEGSNVVRLVNHEVDPTEPIDQKAEYQWVRSVLRRHIASPDEFTGVVVQSINAYMRAIAAEGNLPKEEADEQLNESERASRIAAILESARNRRGGSAADSEDRPVV
ncbi:MAG TPA: hypothetical protein V6D27_01125 [Vampirovibrionales bacterium]